MPAPFLVLCILGLLWKQSNAQSCKGGGVPNTSLQDHVIKTISIVTLASTGLSECKLNNASHLSHPQHIKPEPGAHFAVVKPLSKCSNKFCSKGSGVVQDEEFIGCVLCESALGMDDGQIKNKKVSGSSKISSFWYPRDARLNKKSNDVTWGCRRPAVSQDGEYLSVDLKKVHVARKVATQGMPTTPTHNYQYWVTRYQLKYSTDDIPWLYTKIFLLRTWSASQDGMQMVD
ncbi:predicted protein [Nematostella vectensis]|uniref:F5/8 type C domain-containing protein n=1 Tax=Nematostella vectensis TaxID=45351 RepID=A7SIS8_NEMVE|nr:predicted protein [Nematostella vectensis]|eukprot:XP_001628470.1 predicted protein [Nematostella vectensis]